MCVSSDSMCVANGRFTLIPVSALTGATVWHGPGVLFMPAEHFVYFLNWVNRSCLGLIYSLSSPHSGMNSKEPHTPVNTAEQTLTALSLVHIADIRIQTLSVRWRWRNMFLYVWIQSWMEALRRKAVDLMDFWNASLAYSEKPPLVESFADISSVCPSQISRGVRWNRWETLDLNALLTIVFVCSWVSECIDTARESVLAQKHTHLFVLCCCWW